MYEGRLLKAEWEVRPVELVVAEELVRRYHYARGCSNTATYSHGLFRKGDLFDWQCQGAALWIPPTKSAAKATYPKDWTKVLCLSRLAIAPDVPLNACTFLISRSRRLINRSLWPCLVSYADTWRGHTGGIYLADNWTQVEDTKPEATYTLNGRMVARKAGPTTRTKGEMLEMGAVLEGRFPKHKFVHILEK